jgi:hypothetical protein
LSAQLRLSSGSARLVWPAGAATAAMVLLGDVPEPESRSLADAFAAVVLNAPVREGAAALEWLADHAAELGADGGRLILAGAADDVLWLAARARAQGWPPIALCHILPPSPVEGAWNSRRRSQ